VVISDPDGSGASATAALDNGVISAIDVTKPGSGYITPGGMRKFVDGLPMLCIPDSTVGQTFGDCASNNLGQHMPVAVPDTTTFPNTDYYVIPWCSTASKCTPTCHLLSIQPRVLDRVGHYYASTCS
jgi:hypothetical protein